MKKYTVLLQLPDTIAALCCSPWDDTYLVHAEAPSARDALATARVHAANGLDYEGDPEDFAVLAVFAGHHVDESAPHM